MFLFISKKKYLIMNEEKTKLFNLSLITRLTNIYVKG